MLKKQKIFKIDENVHKFTLNLPSSGLLNEYFMHLFKHNKIIITSELDFTDLFEFSEHSDLQVGHFQFFLFLLSSLFTYFRLHLYVQYISDMHLIKQYLHIV